MSGTWVAIDGGQSTTRARASWAAEDVAVGGFSHEPDGVGAIARNIEHVLSTLPAPPRPIDRLVVGHTGLPIDTASRSQLAAMLVSRHDVRTVVLSPDEVTAHAGALSGEPGVVAAVGTGCVTLGVDARGVGYRVDGWGYLFGDAGSAFAIGRAALEAALRSEDGRGPRTTLVADVAAEYGASPREATWALYLRTDRVDRVARFAQRVVAAAERDDVAATITRHAAEEIATSCVTAARALDGVDVVAVTGRLIGPGSALEREFRVALTRMAPDLEIRAAAGSPLDGSALLASGGTGIYTSLVQQQEGSAE